MINGLPLAATCWINGMKLLSPDAILKTSTSGSRNFALTRSSGVEKKIRPRFRARRSSCTNCSWVSSNFFKRSKRAGSALLVNSCVWNVWNFTASTPASAAASTIRQATSKLPSWLFPISATIRIFSVTSWLAMRMARRERSTTDSEVAVEHVGAAPEREPELGVQPDRRHVGDLRADDPPPTGIARRERSGQRRARTLAVCRGPDRDQIDHCGAVRHQRCEKPHRRPTLACHEQYIAALSEHV